VAKKWIGQVVKKMKHNGTEGTFSRWADSHGLTMREAIAEGKKSKDPLIRKRANLAATFWKISHK
jgi:hypothetical protein